jgi:hypothetical protein
LAEIFQPISFGGLIKLRELLADPSTGLLLGEIGVITLQKFVELFNQKRIVLIRMCLENADLDLFDPVFVEGIEDLSDIGFIDKAFNDPELLICKNLLMD